MGFGRRQLAPLTRRNIASRIRRLAKLYIAELGLGGWEITLVMGKHANRDEDGIAHNITDEEYYRAVVSFDLDDVWREAQKYDNPIGYLHRLVRHELLHCYLTELAGLGEQMAGKNKHLLEVMRRAHERACSRLETLPVWRYVEE